MKSKYYAVEVVWHDAFSSSGWKNTDVAVKDASAPLVCRSIGWCVHRDKTCIVLAQSLSDGGSRLGETLTIPAGMIRTVRHLSSGKRSHRAGRP